MQYLLDWGCYNVQVRKHLQETRAPCGIAAEMQTMQVLREDTCRLEDE